MRSILNFSRWFSTVLTTPYKRSKSAMDENCYTMPAIPNIGILSIDELIPIFYFLNICDRLRAMKVCKKWHRILSSKQAWSVIDFRELNPLVRGKRNGVLWSSRTLEFLKVYAGGSLREIYLSDVLSPKIVNYLRENCPNVTTVSFDIKRPQLTKRYLDQVAHWVAPIPASMLFIPPKVRRYKLRLDPGLEPTVPMLQFISRHAVTLQYLVLENFCISTKVAEAIRALAMKTDLQEIQIIKPWFKPERFKQEDSPDDILATTIGSLTSLKCFRFVSFYRPNKRFSFSPRHGSVLLFNLVVCIGKWQHLKVLALRGVDCSDVAAFESMLLGTLNLESLELEGDIVHTSTIESIGKHLKKLKFLELGNGYYSNESIRSLHRHPELQSLWIHQASNNQRKIEPVWLRIIYDVLMTLPKLRDVKLEGYRLTPTITGDGYVRYKDIAGVKLGIQNY